MTRASTRLAKSSSIRSLGGGAGWASGVGDGCVCGVEVGGTAVGGGFGVAVATGAAVGGGGVVEIGVAAAGAVLAAVATADSVSERWSALSSERRMAEAAAVSSTAVSTAARATAVGRSDRIPALGLPPLPSYGTPVCSRCS